MPPNPSDSGEPTADEHAAEHDADADHMPSPTAIESGQEPGDESPPEPDAAEDRTAPGGPADAGDELADGLWGEAAGPCNARVEQRPIEGFTHVAVCSRVTYLAKPPCSGDHYPIWAAYQSYVAAIPEGFWVHNLEHGAVVVTYNCPGGCTSDVSAAQTWIDGLPDDPICNPDAGEARIRILMTPDPNLDVKFAASSWGWTLRADCFDPTSFGAFVQAHYGHGREALCAQGQDLSLGVADGCGE